MPRIKSVTLLGNASPLHWKANGNSVLIELPDMPEKLMAQPAWVLKFGQ
jgi:hypothetical protein